MLKLRPEVVGDGVMFGLWVSVVLLGLAQVYQWVVVNDLRKLGENNTTSIGLLNTASQNHSQAIGGTMESISILFSNLPKRTDS